MESLFMPGLPRVLNCTYMGFATDGDSRIKSTTRVRFEWKVKTDLFSGICSQTVSAYRSLPRQPLRQSLRPPRELKFPLIVACLPTVVAKRGLVPAMFMREEVICHALGLPKVQGAGKVETVVAQYCGRRQEFIKCAHVVGDICLCHPGGSCEAANLIEMCVSEESAAKQGRGCSDLSHRALPVFEGYAYDKLMAVAHWRAGLLAAEKQKRQPDFSAALEKFNLNPFTWPWRRSVKKKSVVVLWSYKGPDGNVHYEEADVEFKSLVQ